MIEFGIFMIAAFISGFFCGIKVRKAKTEDTEREVKAKVSLFESIKDFIEDYIPGKEHEPDSEVKKVINKSGREKDARYFF